MRKEKRTCGLRREDDGGTKQLKVALVVNQKFGDKASMDDLAKGADQAAEDFGVEIKKLESGGFQIRRRRACNVQGRL